jgi:integrase
MARKRRGRSEGSIYQRADGQWTGSISIGYDANGKRRRRTVYGATKGEVQEKLRKLQLDAASGIVKTPEREQLADYLSRWLEDTARPSVRRNTYASYEQVIRLHIKEHIGGVRLADLTPQHVQGLYAAMERSGDSPRMRQLTHAVLRRALRQALRWGLLLRNPCDAVEPARVARREMTAFGPAEVKRFLAAAAGDRLEAIFVLAVSSGLRQGELFGLQWPDVNLDEGAIHVHRQLEERNGKLALTEPKSDKGRRRVELPAFAAEAMLSHKARMLAEGHLDRTDRPVFCNSHGGFLRKSNFLRKVFKPILKKAGLPDIRFHDLRHTSATLLLSQGVHPKIVQERLGHSQISLTLDTYSHVLPGLQKEAAAKLDGLFGKQA